MDRTRTRNKWESESLTYQRILAASQGFIDPRLKIRPMPLPGLLESLWQEHEPKRYLTMDLFAKKLCAPIMNPTIGYWITVVA